MLTVDGLTAAHKRLEFGDDPHHELRLSPAGDSAHMWQRAYRGQRSTEVQTIELHLTRIVRGRQGSDQSAQRGRLTRLGCPYHREIACGTR